MLQSWLKKLDEDFISNIDSGAWQFGSNIEIFTDEFPNLENKKIALIGLEKDSANIIRRELYKLSFPFKKLKIADLGNFRNTDENFISGCLKELIEGGITPIIFGGGTQTSTAQFFAHKQVQSAVSMLEVDEQIRYDAYQESRHLGPLNDIFKNKQTGLFHFSNIGYQSHFTETPILKYLDSKHFEYLRLGEVRSDIKKTEPLVRDADFMSFNLASLTSIFAPGQEYPTPNGLTAEDACQITRYAGFSDKLRSLSIYGFAPQNDLHGQTGQLLAQMIWYFVDGFFHRKDDFPASQKGMTQYVVSLNNSDSDLSFWKSNSSGRWWIQVPVKTKKKQARHRLIPCSHADYESACREDLPERLMRAFRRFE